jgi:maleylacetoacetate isomerase
MKADESTSDDQDLTLYSYWRSSASYRVRIALNLKGLSYQVKPVHMVRHGGEQHSEEFRAINPQGLIPVLVHQGQVITQSLAICEYLDECFEQYPLLPAQPLERARTRSLASQVACEIHPLNNLRVTKYLRDQYGDVANPVEWMRHWMIEGFSAIEQQLASSNDQYAGKPGLFECFLVPQVYNAERFGTDL